MLCLHAGERGICLTGRIGGVADVMEVAGQGSPISRKKRGRECCGLFRNVVEVFIQRLPLDRGGVLNAVRPSHSRDMVTIKCAGRQAFYCYFIVKNVALPDYFCAFFNFLAVFLVFFSYFGAFGPDFCFTRAKNVKKRSFCCPSPLSHPKSAPNPIFTAECPPASDGDLQGHFFHPRLTISGLGFVKGFVL